MTLNRDTVIDYQAVADRVDGSEMPPKAPRTARPYVVLVALMVGFELAILALALLMQSRP